MAPPDSRMARPRQENGPDQIGADATPIVPRTVDDLDPFNPPQVPVDQALLDLILRRDSWALFAHALAAREQAIRDEAFQEGLDAHPGGGLDGSTGPSFAELRRRRLEYLGRDGRPIRPQTPAAIAARARSSWARLERELEPDPRRREAAERRAEAERWRADRPFARRWSA